MNKKKQIQYVLVLLKKINIQDKSLYKRVSTRILKLNIQFI